VFLAPETWPFTVATILLLCIATVEGIALMLGANLSEWLQHALPDPWDAHMGPFDKALGWLHVGKVPFLIIIVLFLAGFAITGFALNMVVHRFLGLWVTTFISIPIAIFAGLPVVRIVGAGLARLIPSDESWAVTLDTLVGRMGTIVSGTARFGYPAQAKVIAHTGQALYVMVEPDNESAQFQTGASVLLVRQISGTRFYAIANPRPDLL
jgi:hypothetical protein